MSDLISRSALIKRIKEEPTDGMFIHEIIEVIDEQPTVEARPVVRGGWIKGDMDEWVCSNCHEENCYAYDDNIKKFTDYFCPNCGCDMRGEKND